MSDAHDFLRNLALVLCVAAVTTVVFQRLRQPVVFGYLLAGMVVGPHLPIPLVADERMIRALAELGVVLLMFSLGLDFRLSRLAEVAGSAGLIAIIETSAMAWLGYSVAQLLGWGVVERVFAGATVAISSTTIIVKAFEEQKVRGRFTETVFGVLIFEDLIAIFLLALLTTLSAGAAASGVSAGGLGIAGVRLASFLAGIVGFGLLVVPRFMRAVVRLARPETTLVASVGVCFAFALVALEFGYSVALGAFVAGSLVAESGEARIVEPLVHPVRDIFAAIFFVSVGMLLDPGVVGRQWPTVLLLTLVVIVGKIAAVSVAAFLAGQGVRGAIQSGMSLAQIGEFSFIIAGLGAASGVVRDSLYPVVVAVSAITTLATPWLIRASGPVATWVDRTLPRPLQTFTTLYGTWVERLRSSPTQGGGSSSTRRLSRLVLADAALLAVVVIGAATQRDWIAAGLVATVALTLPLARLAVVGGAMVLAIPLFVGLVRTAGRLGLELALRALPAGRPGRVDNAAAPRRALVVTLQLGVLAVVGVPLLAITQPFLPAMRGTLLFAVVLVLVFVAVWRSIANLQGHTRAGAEVIAMALSRQMARDPTPAAQTATMELVRQMLPGLGEPIPIRLDRGSAAIDRTLAEVNLRGLTGATVLALIREGHEAIVPNGRELLCAGDVLAVAGTHEAIEAAARLLAGTPSDAAKGEHARE